MGAWSLMCVVETWVPVRQFKFPPPGGGAFHHPRASLCLFPFWSPFSDWDSSLFFLPAAASFSLSPPSPRPSVCGVSRRHSALVTAPSVLLPAQILLKKDRRPRSLFTCRSLRVRRHQSPPLHFERANQPPRTRKSDFSPGSCRRLRQLTIL